MEKIVPDNTSDYVRYLIGRARFLMVNARRKELLPYHISNRQYYILSLLYNLGRSTTLTELAWNTDRKINTLSLNMTKMEKKGLVKKIRKTPNSTRLKFELTEKGYNTFLKCKNMKSNETIVSVLSEKECQQLIQIMKKIIGKAETLK